MRKTLLLLIAAFVFTANLVWADTFGTGDNAFTIDFVTITGDASSANGTYIGGDRPEGFIDPGYDYRIGKFEITNDQWNKFKNEYGTVTGSPSSAYHPNPYWTGTNVPTNAVSWYEAAQFVNWLNTSSGKSAAYKFTGTQGTSNYTFVPWVSTDTGYNASNPYRNSNAFYFLPMEDEWVKAAYWNGTNLQMYATVGDVTPTQAGWNFYDNSYATDPYGPWDVGSGSEELNGTFDMMGNIFEWMESPRTSGSYLSDSLRGIRGGSFGHYGVYGYYPYSSGIIYLRSSGRPSENPSIEASGGGFRVASVPEPCTVLLLGLGGLMIKRGK